MLLTVAMASGAVLADNLVLLLVFWEGLLLTLFGMIATGDRRPYGTAIKAFIIVGVTDLCMMLGVMLTGRLAGTLDMSAIKLPVDGLGGVAFLLLGIGAMGKAGAMPFHSWIPDAALDAPLPFMAILPASIEKLLGIYFLARISLDLFTLTPGHAGSRRSLMVVGAVTIILAVLMALVQKNYKRLLSYHAISQVGYMILGIGTALPIGIIGGLFHMINHAMYKSCLFLTGGAVEKQAGTTDLEKLGGPRPQHAGHRHLLHRGGRLDLGGAPVQRVLLQGDGLRRGPGERAGYSTPWRCSAPSSPPPPSSSSATRPSSESARSDAPTVKEAPLPMLIPMIVLAGLCILFGVGNSIPLGGLIQPAVGTAVTGGRSFAGFPASTLLIELTAAALLLAVLNHWYGVRKTGRGLGAVDHIHNAIFLAPVYAVAEKGQLDPYFIGRWVMKGASICALRRRPGVRLDLRHARGENRRRESPGWRGARTTGTSTATSCGPWRGRQRGDPLRRGGVRRRQMSDLLLLIPFVGLIVPQRAAEECPGAACRPLDGDLRVPDRGGGPAAVRRHRLVLHGAACES